MSKVAVDADVILTDYDDLDDFRDAIQSALEEPVCHILLHPAQRPVLTLLDVFRVLVEELDTTEDDVSVWCVVTSVAVANRLRQHLPSTVRRRRQLAAHALRVTLMTGDITRVTSDAIVNTSNTRLVLGGGVSGALRRACGPRLQAAMDNIGRLAIDGIASTAAFDLKTVDRILHVPTANGDAQTVSTAMQNILRYCETHRLSAVAIPGLGMGTGGLSARRCAELCVGEVVHFASRTPTSGLQHVCFVLWSDVDYQSFEAVFLEALSERAEDGSGVGGVGD